MEIFDNLASYGLTTSILQVIIIGGALLLIIGYYWKYIVAGLGVIFCVAVFAMPVKKADKTIEVVSQPATTEVQPETKPEVKPELSDKDMFMEDCLKYGGYTPSQCVALWNDRENDKVRFRKATNQIFMTKAKYHYL